MGTDWRKAECCMVTRSLVLSAQTSDWYKLRELLYIFMTELRISPDIVNRVIIASEEIFVNISHYAYPGVSGEVFVNIEYFPEEKRLKVRFTDSGIPFDPTSVVEPDVTQKASDRKIGGLGIFIVNKIMDSMEYKYSEGKNNLVLIKTTR